VNQFTQKFVESLPVVTLVPHGKAGVFTLHFYNSLLVNLVDYKETSLEAPSSPGLSLTAKYLGVVHLHDSY
jgi:hypothetical protein